MKKITTIIILLLTFVACNNKKEKSVDEILSTNNLKEIRAYKDQLSIKQQALLKDIDLLEHKIAEIDTTKKTTIVSTFTVKPTPFKHYLSLQGSVSTKNLLVLTPEFSGILTQVYATDGQRVKKGQLLAKIDDGGMGQQLAQLQIQANLAKTTFERQARLWKQKIGSEIQYLQAKSSFEAQQKVVSQMQKQLNKTQIRAPFSGTIDEVITEKGSVVAAGRTPVFRILNLKDMYIETDISENYIRNIQKGKEVQINFPVLGKTIQAKVKQVSHFINPANRTFKADIAIPNTEKGIKPNLTGKLKINDYTNPKALLIPQDVILKNASGKQYVFTIKTNNNTTTAVKSFIKTGLSQGNLVEVIEGLTPNTQIITEGAKWVQDQQEVEIIQN